MDTIPTSSQQPLPSAWRAVLRGLALLMGLSLSVLASSPAGAALPASQAMQSQVHLPLLNNRACSGLRSPTVFGVQTYSASGNTSRFFPLLRDSGTTWVREAVDWYLIEPENVAPSEYDWTQTDIALRGARDACFNMIATIDSAPAWAAPRPRSPIYGSQMPEFQQFVGALVERYDGDGIADAPSGLVVNYWEFYNEPDHAAQPGGGWGEHGNEYAAMLSEVYPVVKAANPHAQVVFGGIAYDAFTEHGGPYVRRFLEDVLATEIDDRPVGDFFDIMNFHYYPAFRGSWTPGNDTGLPGKVSAIRDILDKHDLEKPLMITESGWHSGGNDQYPSSDEIQSQYVLQLFTQAKALGVDAFIWWLFYDLSNNYFARYGLVTDSETPVPKPSYAVFRTAATRLGAAAFDDEVETDHPDLEAYRFVDPGGQTFLVAWVNPINAAQTVPLQLEGEAATQYSIDNRLVSIIQDTDDGADDNGLTVQVGGSPVYIVIDEIVINED
jgi:hypothetical protein